MNDAKHTPKGRPDSTRKPAVKPASVEDLRKRFSAGGAANGQGYGSLVEAMRKLKKR